MSVKYISLKPHILYSQTSVYRGKQFFIVLIKNRLWELVLRVSKINVLSINKTKLFFNRNFQFLRHHKLTSILHKNNFVMFRVRILSDGEIKTLIDIDYEAVPVAARTCTLTAIANDNTVNSDPGIYTITIVDVPEPPALSKNTYSYSTQEVNVSPSGKHVRENYTTMSPTFI